MDKLKIKKNGQFIQIPLSAFDNDTNFIDNTYHDNTKVDKENGKGLSTNDYTTEEKTKLSGIEAGAEKNKVTSVNNQTGDVVINVPTKLSDLTNDAGFITGYTETDPTVPTHVKSITEQDITNWNNKSSFSGSYNDLSDKPNIPTKISDLTNDSDFVSDSNYVHTDNNFTNDEKTKLSGIEENANNYILPNDVVEDSNYVHTDFNFTQAYKNKINNILPLIPQTRIAQLVEDGVKYLKIDWDINDLIVNYQNKGKVKLFLYKYTKTGRKTWVDKQTGLETYKTSIKKWVHPCNEYRSNDAAHQCWGIRSFQANPTFADDIDEIIENSDYPIANNGLVQTEYIISAGQNSLKIPLNDIVSPILKVENTGTAQVVLPKLGDKRNVKLMGVKQKPAGSRCNQPIKFCLAVEDDVGHICIGSCLNIATIQLFKYRTDMNNHSGHGYSNGYSVLPDIGYSVFIK